MIVENLNLQILGMYAGRVLAERRHEVEGRVRDIAEQLLPHWQRTKGRVYDRIRTLELGGGLYRDIGEEHRPIRGRVNYHQVLSDYVMVLGMPKPRKLLLCDALSYIRPGFQFCSSKVKPMYPATGETELPYASALTRMLEQLAAGAVPEQLRRTPETKQLVLKF
jgi:hypothetical protein